MSSATTLLLAGTVSGTVFALALPHRPRRSRRTHTAPPTAAARAHAGTHRPRHPHEALVAAAISELHLDLDPTACLAALRWTTALAVATALLGSGPLAAALVGGVALTTPRITRRMLVIRTAARREEQLAPMLERMASDLRAGSALGPALVTATRLTPAPLGDDLRAVAAEFEHGAALNDALSRWGERNGVGTQVHLAAAALTVAAEAGGELARSVDRVASTVRERRDLRAEVRALATQARASAAVLVVAPLGFAVLVAGVEPGVVTFLVASSAGLLCLSAGLALDALGAAWMARILRDAP